MVVVALTDIHGRTARLQDFSSRISDADLIILCGDITNFGGEEDAERVIEHVKRFNGSIYAVIGNCDYPGVESYLTRQGINLHGRCLPIDEFVVIGLGGSLPTPAGTTPNEYSEEELRLFLEEASTTIPKDRRLLLVSHQPPLNTACDLIHGVHVGSNAVREFIEQYQPVVCFTGHIHESRGIDRIGATKIVNPGPLHKGGYAVLEMNEEKETLHLMEGRHLICTI